MCRDWMPQHNSHSFTIMLSIPKFLDSVSTTFTKLQSHKIAITEFTIFKVRVDERGN